MDNTTAVQVENAEPVAKPKWYRQLYFWVIVAIVAGILVGWLAPGFGKAMEPIGTTFVTAMRMLIGPIVFLTIIGGIAGVADLKKVGVTGVKALVYFQVGTLLALGGLRREHGEDDERSQPDEQCRDERGGSEHRAEQQRAADRGDSGTQRRRHQSDEDALEPQHPAQLPGRGAAG